MDGQDVGETGGWKLLVRSGHELEDVFALGPKKVGALESGEVLDARCLVVETEALVAIVVAVAQVETVVVLVLEVFVLDLVGVEPGVLTVVRIADRIASEMPVHRSVVFGRLERVFEENPVESCPLQTLALQPLRFRYRFHQQRLSCDIGTASLERVAALQRGCFLAVVACCRDHPLGVQNEADLPWSFPSILPPS